MTGQGGNSLIAAGLGPAIATTYVNNFKVQVESETDYPFDEYVYFHVSTLIDAEFPFCVKSLQVS